MNTSLVLLLLLLDQFCVVVAGWPILVKAKQTTVSAITANDNDKWLNPSTDDTTKQSEAPKGKLKCFVYKYNQSTTEPTLKSTREKCQSCVHMHRLDHTTIVKMCYGKKCGVKTEFGELPAANQVSQMEDSSGSPIEVYCCEENECNNFKGEGCSSAPMANELPDSAAIVTKKKSSNFQHGYVFPIKCRDKHFWPEPQPTYANRTVTCYKGKWQHNIQPCIGPCASLPTDLHRSVKVSPNKGNQAPFDNGTVRSVVCANRFSRPKDQKDGGVTCIGGKWTHDYQHCRKIIDCDYTWSAPSVTCGQGVLKLIVHVKEANGGIKCPTKTEIDYNTQVECRESEENDCVATDCVWSQWSAWSKCSVSCENGIQERTRTIEEKAKGGGRCLGATQSTQVCVTGMPCRPFTVSDSGLPQFEPRDSGGNLAFAIAMSLGYGILLLVVLFLIRHFSLKRRSSRTARAKKSDSDSQDDDATTENTAATENTEATEATDNTAATDNTNVTSTKD